MKPEVSVVVPTRGRPLRLRWLLNALEEQEMGSGRFEVIVAHDSPGTETAALLAEHPLAASGALRALELAPPRTAGALRNAGWRSARAPLIAFTDDDCRPPSRWLESLVDAGRRLPGAIVQGPTRPDPDEAALLIAAGFHRTIEAEPPEVECRTCNVLYPREVLERTGGFDEDLVAAEDIDLGARARKLGVPVTGAAAAETFHMVDPGGVVALMRSQWRYRVLPDVVARHPQLRRSFPLWLFWKPAHPALLALVASLALVRRHPAALVVTLCWALWRAPSYGSGPRGRLRAASELPARALVDAAEVATCALGSARSRTLFL